MRPLVCQAIIALALLPPCRALAAQSADTTLDALVQVALAMNPEIRAAEARVRAATARVSQAGARPDPMLMAGLINFPIAEPGFGDFMTMKMIGLSQSFPYPGKLRLSTTAATREVDGAEADLQTARLDVVRQVRIAFYDLAMRDQLLAIVARNQRLLVSLMQATEASYRVGRSGQEDVLRARMEGARLGTEAANLIETRQATLARLNALLERPSDVPVPGPVIPPRIVRAAVADSASRIHFASAVLGARAADSPLPPLDELQALAIRKSPAVRAHVARVAAQEARIALARKAALPDFDISLQYGQRTGFSDMVSATVSIPLPLQAGRKQHQAVTEADADLAALAAEHHAMVDELQGRVAELVTSLEQKRTELALLKKAILPEGQAALEAATAGFQVGRTDFQTLLDRQATLFNYQTQYARALAEFATNIATLEQTVGQEILP